MINSKINQHFIEYFNSVEMEAAVGSFDEHNNFILS